MSSRGARSRIGSARCSTPTFAIVAPPFAVERARMRPPPSVPSQEHEIPASISTVLERLVSAFDISPRPPVYFEKDQAATCKLQMRLRDGRLVPVLVFGKPVIEKTSSEHELAFTLARQLADLRTERIARLLCPRAGELSQIIEMAIAPVDEANTSATKWLQTLHPVELEQVRTVGARLRERKIQPMAAAIGWLAATERAADRIGYVVAGDLPRCVRIIESEPNDSPLRITELVWSSVSDELCAVRARVEGWVAVPPPIPAKATEPRRA